MPAIDPMEAEAADDQRQVREAQTVERLTFLASRLPCKLRAARWQRAPRCQPAEEPDCPAMRRALLQPGLRLPPVQQFGSTEAMP